ncbi:uncharacterized protein [Haliotis cracherodii]|uniref:uncharacterized protein n=1 Tax=Haliotis cracherodii TaxID=6455 RepID=UPI0039ED7865
MPRLSRANRHIAIGLLEAGQSQLTVARRMNVHQSTISRLWERYRQQNSVEDGLRSGRPRVITAAKDRLKPDRTSGCPGQTSATALPTAPDTPATSTCTTGRVGYIAATSDSETNSFYAETMSRSSERKWWSYEQVDRFGGGKRHGVGRHSSRRPDSACRSGWFSGLRYRDEFLQRHVVPSINANGAIFQQDKARPHVARVCTKLLRQNNVPTLPWPARSPDLSPYLWDVLDRRVRQRQPPPQTLQELFAALEQEWQNIPLAVIRTSMVSSGSR